MRRLVLALLLLGVLGGDGSAQNLTTDGTLTWVMPERAQTLTVQGHRGMVARIDLKTGALEFGPGMTAEEGAREAWRVLARSVPGVLREVGVERCARVLFGEEP